MSFITDAQSKYAMLASSGSYPELLLSLMYATNDSAQVARNKFNEVAMMNGKIRMASDEEMNSNPEGVYNNARSIIENAKLCKYLNQYINRTDTDDPTDTTPIKRQQLNKIKILCVYLCFTGFLYRNHDSIQFPSNIFIRNSGGTDPDDKSIKSITDALYEDMITSSGRLFEEFYSRYPYLVEEKNLGRTDYLLKKDFHSNMRSYITNNLEISDEDRETLISDINTLNETISKKVSVELNTLYKLFELSSSTYDRGKPKVFKELYDKLPTAESNYLLMEFN